MRIEDDVYAASAGDLLAALNRIPDEIGSAMLIGHNPGLHDLALQLADRVYVIETANKYTIAGLFFLPDPWRVVVLVCAALVEVGEVFFWIRFLRRYPVTTGAEGLVGDRGEVIVRCAPRGRDRRTTERCRTRDAPVRRCWEP